MTVRVVFALVIGISTASSAAAQERAVPADAMIQLQRTSCFGACPIYTVAIDARGVVTYTGDMFVRVLGRQTARIDPALVAALLASAERIHFFDLNDVYRFITSPDGSVTAVTDLPTTIVTITVNGRTKSVEDYLGAPDVLAAFEHEIDETAHTTRWVFIDKEALDALVRSGWAASSDDGARLLLQAIERDDIEVARTLIDAGADLHGPPENRWQPLEAAESGSMVDLLVKAGADPNESRAHDPGWTALMSASHKAPDVAGALVQAGARLESLANGRTALWGAACGGNWRVVTVLLRAGANARGGTAVSALECTRQARRDEMNRQRTALDRGRPTVDDFDKVIALLEDAEKGSSRY